MARIAQIYGLVSAIIYQVVEIYMERVTGIEPATFCLGRNIFHANFNILDVFRHRYATRIH